MTRIRIPKSRTFPAMLPAGRSFFAKAGAPAANKLAVAAIAIIIRRASVRRLGLRAHASVRIAAHQRLGLVERMLREIVNGLVATPADPGAPCRRHGLPFLVA